MSLSGMAESPRQPDVIRKILQHLALENGRVSSFGYLVFSPPAPADDMVNGFRKMDARFPTQELPYLTQNQKST